MSASRFSRRYFMILNLSIGRLSAISSNVSCAWRTNARTRSGDFLPLRHSTPEFTSTAYGFTVIIASRTFSGVRPPARMTGAVAASTMRELILQSWVWPVPPILVAVTVATSGGTAAIIAAACGVVISSSVGYFSPIRKPSPSAPADIASVTSSRLVFPQIFTFKRDLQKRTYRTFDRLTLQRFGSRCLFKYSTIGLWRLGGCENSIRADKIPLPKPWRLFQHGRMGARLH